MQQNKLRNKQTTKIQTIIEPCHSWQSHEFESDLRYDYSHIDMTTDQISASKLGFKLFKETDIHCSSPVGSPIYKFVTVLYTTAIRGGIKKTVFF